MRLARRHLAGQSWSRLVLFKRSCAEAPVLAACAVTPSGPLLDASPLLLWLAGRCRRVRDDGHRRQRAHGLLAAVPAADRRVRLGPRSDGGCVLIRVPGV